MRCRTSELYLWKATRPTEMLSVAEAVLRYRPAADDALHLETVLQWIFDHGELEPRGFATMGPALVSKIGDLDARHRTLGVRNATALRALRRYLVAQVSGPRCADSVAERRALDGFNRLVAGRSEPGLTLISASESRPSRILSPARLNRLWQTGESRWLRNEAVALVRRGEEAVHRGAEEHQGLAGSRVSVPAQSRTVERRTRTCRVRLPLRKSGALDRLHRDRAIGPAAHQGAQRRDGLSCVAVPDASRRLRGSSMSSGCSIWPGAATAR